MSQIEKKYFGGGSGNYDDADIVVGPDQWVNLENCRVGATDFAEGAIGYVESIGSTGLIANTLPGGQNYCIGGAWDQVRDRLIWGNWNEFGNHAIYAYDIFSKTIYIVLLSGNVTGGLNFSKYSCIHSCFVINGTFYWTDGTNNEPRSLNIDSGIKAYTPSYVTDEVAYTFPIAQSVIALIRRPPGLPPRLFKSTQVVPPLSTNFIKYEAFEAQYRYQYRNFEVSTLSARSALSNYNRTTDTYNHTILQIPLAEIVEQDVLQVDLVVRYVDGKAFIIKSWNKNNPADATAIANHNSGFAALTYNFFNDQVGIALDSAYSVKPFDSVPLFAETCATAKNRNFLANYTIGYDTPQTSSLTASAVTGTPTDRLFKSDAAYQLSITFYDNYQRKTGYKATTGAKVIIPERQYGTTSFVTQIAWLLSNVSALVEIPQTAYYYSVNITRCLRTRFFLQLRGKSSTYLKKDADGNYQFNNDNYSADLAACAFDISTLTTFGMGYVFSEGDIVKIYIGSNVYSLGIIGQQGNYIITELQNLGTLNAATQFLFEIYTPYKPSTEEPAYEVTQIFQVSNPTTLARQYSTTSGTIDGDVYIMPRTGINQIYYTINTVPDTRNDDGLATIGALYSGQIAPDGNVSTGSSPFGGLAGFNIATNNDRWIIRNNTGANITFDISGSITNMPDSNRNWRVFVADNTSFLAQTDLIPSKAVTAGVTITTNFSNVRVTLGAGNRLFIFHEQSVANSMYYFAVNLTISLVSTNITYNVEAMSPNDKFYRNWNFPDTGRPNNIDNVGQVTRENSVAYSNTLVAGSRTNGLSSFDALDTKPIPQECGPINKLQVASKVEEIGTVMLAICLNETASLYLGEVQLVGASANAFLAQAPEVIGTINILKGSYGTKNPESVQEFRGNVHWFDGPNGKYIQYSPNGLFPTSDYKMTKLWHLFSHQYTSMSATDIEALGSRPFVFTGIDPQNEEVLVSIPRVLADPPKGYLPDYPNMIYPWDIWDGQEKSVVFRLKAQPNFWNGAFKIPSEQFIYAKDELYSFRNGQLYQHNQEGFGNFYGVQHKARIMCLANQIPSRPKVYDNLSVESNLTPTLVYLRSENPYVQASDLLNFDFTNKEGILYAKNGIYRNKIVPTSSGVNYNGLLTAEKMRTNVLRILLEFDATTVPLQLRFLNIGYQVSKGHNT